VKTIIVAKVGCRWQNHWEFAKINLLASTTLSKQPHS